MRGDVLSRTFKRAVKKIGQPDLTFHGLRHGFATQASNAGLPLRDIQAAGGWASLVMVNHYVKPMPLAMERIASTLGAKLESLGL
jgi:integrase